MRNFVQQGKTITVPAPADVAGGSIVQVGNIIGIASHPAATGEDLELAVEGVFLLAKGAQIATTVGQRLTVTTANALSTADSNPAIGVALQATTAAVPNVEVRLNGSF